VPSIVYDFRADGALRKQRIGDWRQPAKREPEPKAAGPEMPDWIFVEDGMSHQINRSEAELPVIMRADRVVQKRRRDAQALIDLEATEESVSAKRRIERRTR
jgi:hypothetical protein